MENQNTESTSTADTVAATPVVAEKKSRFAAAAAALRSAPKWALITVPAVAVALAGYAYTHRDNQNVDNNGIVAMQAPANGPQGMAPVAYGPAYGAPVGYYGPYPGPYYGSGYGHDGYGYGHGYGRGYGRGHGHGTGRMNANFSFGGNFSGDGDGYTVGNGAGHGVGNGRNGGWW